MSNLFRQFFDRYTLYGFGALIALHGVAWMTQHTIWSAIPLLLAAGVVGVVAGRSLTWGLSLAMLEIMIGGHGHLIDVSFGGVTIGLRLAIFAALTVATLYHIVVRKVRPVFVTERDIPLLFLMAAVGLGAVTGILNNGFSAAFNDANAFVTVFYLVPVSMIVWTNGAKRRLLWTVGLGATWVAATSLVLLFCFTHLPGDVLWGIYKFARDARLAEITLLSNPAWLVALLPNGSWYFRVFQPGQFYVIVLTLLLCAGWKEWIFEKSKLGILGVLALLFAVDLAGQSRSFWLALFAGGAVLAAGLFYERTPLKKILSVKAFGALALALSILGLWLTVVFPFPARPDLTNNPFYKGSADNTRGLAVTSRWNLLTPLMAAISEAPLIGSGFGTTVTYISDDPRLRAANGTGEYTTDRFEWGYQDIWLKMGIPGLLALFAILLTFLRAGLRAVLDKHEDRWIVVGMTAAVIALYVTHVFSPYLNHPIGIGFLVFALPFLPWQKKSLPALSDIAEKIPNPHIKPLRAPIIASQK